MHPLVRAAYLASPPLVVAFALAGRVDIDLTTEPLGTGRGRAAGHAGRHLADARARCATVVGRVDRRRSCSARPTRRSSRATSGGARSPIPEGDRYAWDDASTYIANPPFFQGLTAGAGAAHRHRRRARARAPRRLGDHRPHQPRRLDRRLVARRPVAPGAAASRRSTSTVRRPPRPPRGDDARHVRQHPPAQPPRRGQGGPVHGPPARRRARRSSTTRRCATGPRACPAWSSPARSTAPARRATGRPRARRCWASGRSSPRATSGSTARTSWAWACCRSSSCRARAPRRSG